MSSRRCETSFEPLRAIAQQAADVDVGEVGVGAALGRGDADLGRGRVVVELDEEALQQLAGGFARERAVGQAALVERQQVLVEMAGVERIPAVQFGDHRQVAEPVILQRLVEIARRVRRHVAADFGDLQQLRPALRASASFAASSRASAAWRSANRITASQEMSKDLSVSRFS